MNNIYRFNNSTYQTTSEYLNYFNPLKLSTPIFRTFTGVNVNHKNVCDIMFKLGDNYFPYYIESKQRKIYFKDSLIYSLKINKDKSIKLEIKEFSLSYIIVPKENILDSLVDYICFLYEEYCLAENSSLSQKALKLKRKINKKINVIME